MVIKAIFFDLDGTLAQSIFLLREMYSDFVSHFGVTGSTEEFNEINGKNFNEIVVLFKERYALSENVAQLEAIYRDAVVTAYGRVSAAAGADMLLRQLAAEGYILGLVTSAPRILAESFIKGQGWETLFSLSMCGDEVAHAKPDPEIYRRALALSGDIPEEVVVIEDSPHGVQAARLAGIRTIGLAQENDAKNLLVAGADATVPMLSQIPPVISLWKNEPYRVVAVGDIVLRVVPPAPEYEQQRARYASRIEKIWNEMSRTRPLHNGTVFAVSGFEDKSGDIGVSGYPVPYKDFLAEHTDQSIHLGIRPVGVSGLLLVQDAQNVRYVVFARRKTTVTQWPGRLELVPSGSIDAEQPKTDGIVSYEMQIVGELMEEAGVSPTDVMSVKGFALVYDPHDRVYDICCRIELSLRKEALGKSFRDSAEYEQPVFVPYRELEQFAVSHEEEIVPTSLALLAAQRILLQ